MPNLRFTEKPLSEWMKEGGEHSDVVISSRVRIARNLVHHPFPIVASAEQAEQVQGQLIEALESESVQSIGTFEPIILSELDDVDKEVLMEKHLISPSLINESRAGAVLLAEDESVSIMLNEEDHLRIQCLYPGFQLQEAWERASGIDDAFEKAVNYAFDDHRGYMTSCPTNMGTGLRASVMLHLPALAIMNQVGRILSAVSQVGLAVRGLYGEGSEAIGNIFQISNQITLGLSEEEIIDNLRSVVLQIIEYEQHARNRLLTESRLRITDRIMRSYGILCYATMMDSKEAFQRISDVRLGVDLGLIDKTTVTQMNELMIMTQSGFLQKTFGVKMGSGERDMYRAQLIRDKLGNVHVED
ncbi:protein arginine kinase [Paenibacillus bovis]|uniref:Protein-arginine kinase n=1 Tax=Paenibacillus bovis TaxID=1616788 RepID=A0A172ZL88_9BACL|nr:protein arginine kinase [Paenibacillus bovis]ANF98415.1 protein arginine kinase [Paenibacillus bovis]